MCSVNATAVSQRERIERLRGKIFEELKGREEKNASGLLETEELTT